MGGENVSMQQLLLPLFPLNVVLFPRTPLPLHIFEDRYREMIGEALESKTEFGVVMLREQSLAGIGCTAVIERVVERHEDGRLDILTGGRRRFRIESLDEERNFLRGKVEFFDDEEPPSEIPAELRVRVLEGYEALSGVLDDPTWVPNLDDSQVSFQLAQPLQDLDFRQVMLNSRTELERLRRLADYLPQFAARERLIKHVRTVAPKNGHGHRNIETE